jgi:hypothetical protein
MVSRMRTWVWWVAGVIAVAAAGSAHAATGGLLITWKPDEVRRYSVAETAKIGSQLVSVRSTFAERVRAVRPDGRAELEISVEALEVCTGRPARCVHPPLGHALRTTRAESDRRGAVTAQRVLTVLLRDGHPRLELCDPRTPPSRDLQAFEAVPLQLLDLLALPESHPTPGVAVERRVGATTLRWLLAAIDSRIASVRVTSDGHAPLTADLSARFAAATGELLDARGTLIHWQPQKRNSVFVLERK